MPRTLTLHREALTELTTAELASVAGGTSISVTDLSYTFQVGCLTLHCTR